MSIQSVLRENAYEFALADQADLATEGSSWIWHDASNVSVDEIVVEAKPNGPIRSRGGSVHPYLGRRWWAIKFRVPAHGQVAAYAHASSTPAFGGGMLPLLAALGGANGDTNAIAYAAADVSPVDGNTVDCATTPGATSPGSLLAFGAAGVVTGMGWVEAVTHPSTPYVVQFREDLGAVPGSGVLRYPTCSAIVVKDTPWYFTARLVGEDTDQDYRFLGGVPSAVHLKLDADRWWLDYEMICYGGTNFAGADGGLDRAHTSYLALEPMLGRGGARVTLGGNVISAMDDGTADPSGSDDVRDLGFDIEIPHDPILNPSGPEGVSDVRVLTPNIMANLWIPRTSAYQVSAVDIVETARQNRTPLALNVYQGDTAGRLFALGMPAGRVVSAKPAYNNGTWGTAVGLAAGLYDGDGASTGAGNKVFVAAVG
jgi:hypothetical protein